jgi:hypothetical protein
MKTITKKQICILKTLAVIILSMPGATVFAQGHWKEITLYTNSGDSIKGVISYKNQFKTYKFISVKNEGITKKYTPATIKAFTIQLDEQKAYFKSLVTEADYSSDEPNKMSASPELKLTKDTVFAQSILKGKRNLYYYIDNNVFKKHFLIETDNDHATDLVNKSYYTDASRSMVGYNRAYKSQLRSFLAGDGTISKDRVNETPFDKKSIVRIVGDYNKANVSSATTPLYEYKEEKIVLDFGVLAGGNITSIRVESYENFYRQLKFKSSTGFNVGLMLNVIFPATRKRLSLYNELLYSSYKLTAKGFYDYYNNENWYRQFKSGSVEASYLKLYTALRYQSTKRFAPFVQLGIVNGYAVHHATHASFETRFYSSIGTEDTPLLDFQTYEQSVFGGIGANYKKVGLELRYERSNGMSEKVSSIMSYTYCLLSYTF